MPLPLFLELYQLIIQHVADTSDLLSLALCCTAFRDEAQRLLFRHVEVESRHRHTPFPAAINAAPLRLGPLVHALDFKPLLGSNMMDKAWTVPLSQALRAMCNLKHLSIDRVNPSTVLHNCAFKLHSLYCSCLLGKSEVLFLLSNFLPTQHSMKRLQFYFSVPFGVVDVPMNLCPHLDFLGVGENDFVNVLLRDTRLITRFGWYALGKPPILSSRQLNHLEYLHFIIFGRNMDTSFTAKLASLVHLELHIKLSIADALLTRIQFLQDIPHLSVLVFQIHGDYLYESLAGGRLEDEYHLRPTFTAAYQHAFKLRPTLRYIDAGRVDYPLYTRLLPPRDGRDGPLVADAIVHEQEVWEWRLCV